MDEKTYRLSVLLLLESINESLQKIVLAQGKDPHPLHFGRMHGVLSKVIGDDFKL